MWKINTAAGWQGPTGTITGSQGDTTRELWGWFRLVVRW